MILSAVQTFLFVFLGNWILEIKSLTFNYWLVLFTTSAFANLVGLNVSSALNNVVNIYILIPFIIVPELLFGGVLVSFNKLHKDFASADCVPIVGDVMTSRWAYEALALTQFEDNQYSKYFYKVEREISQANYDATFLVPRLKTLNENTMRALKTGENIDKVDRDLKVIKNMIEEICKVRGLQFEKINSLTKDGFNDTVSDELDSFLDDLKAKAEKEQYIAGERKDEIYAELIHTLGSRSAVQQLQMENQNKRLDEMLLNKNEVEKILMTSDFRLVQQKDPAYHITRFTNGRSHFYSPIKKLGSWEIPTFTFNLVFIWLTTTFFYFALRFTWLKKVLDKISGFKISLKHKKDKKQETVQK